MREEKENWGRRRVFLFLGLLYILFLSASFHVPPPPRPDEEKAQP